MSGRRARWGRWLLAAAMCTQPLMSVALGRQSLGEAAQQLEARDARERRKAAQALGDLGSLQAFALLLSRGLEDKEPMVADEAQLQLGRVAREDTAALVFGRHVLGHRDALLRLRAAEALGRMRVTLDARLWLQALKENDPRAARAFVESLELHAREQRIAGDTDGLVKSVLRTARRDKDLGVRAAALLALAHLAPVPARELAEEQRDAKDPALRAAAFGAWLALDPSGAVTHASAVLDDEDTGLRAWAVRTLVEVGDRTAVRELIGRLEREPRARVQDALVAGLRALSGLKHGADVRPWRAWADELPDDFTPPERAAKGQSEPGARDDDEQRTTTFVGHAVRSDRVTFVIDMSGSMWKEADGGVTRKARVEAELRKALEALPATARFNVLPYADLPMPWEKGLVDATPKNVARALEAFERSTLRGKGDAYGALVRALEDPEVDTLVLLTDGAPSGGERWNVELMGHLFARENRLRNVAVDVVLFEARRALVGYWSALSEASGGRVTEVEF